MENLTQQNEKGKPGEAARREAERALRAGDISLAVELYAVAGEIVADEMRRMSRSELAMLEPQLFDGCDCEVA